MYISSKQIKEYQLIHKRVFGKNVTKAQAEAEGLLLIKLVSLMQKTSGGY